MIDYMICFILIACISAEVYLILVKNRRLKLKGKDDFFVFALIVFFAMMIFPLSETDNLLENIRSILFLITIFGSAAIKRGFSEKGMEKVCYTVPWEMMKEVQINSYQTAKMQVVCITDRGKHKLLFSKFRIKEVLGVLEKHVPDIYIQSSLEETLNMKKE